MNSYQSNTENNDLVMVLFPLGKCLENIQQGLMTNNTAKVQENIEMFQRHFHGIDVKKMFHKLSKNRNVNDPEAERWRKLHIQLQNNISRKTKIEVLDEDDLPTTTTSVDPLICDQHLMDNQFNQCDMELSVGESSTEEENSIVEKVEKKRKRSKRKNTTRESNSESSSEEMANYSCSSPLKERNRNKRNTRNRPEPKERYCESTSEDLDKHSSYNPKRKRISIRREVKGKNQPIIENSDSESTEGTTSTSDESLELDKKRVKQSSTTKRTETEEGDNSTNYKIMQDMLQNLVSTPVPTIERINREIEQATIHSNTIGYNYYMRKKVPESVNLLWEKFPLVFFIISFKTIQNAATAKCLTKILSENKTLGNHYSKLPTNCPPIKQLLMK